LEPSWLLAGRLACYYRPGGPGRVLLLPRLSLPSRPTTRTSVLVAARPKPPQDLGGTDGVSGTECDRLQPLHLGGRMGIREGVRDGTERE
jgi:hypothetical protein